jgi:hypothetical protein
MRSAVPSKESSGFGLFDSLPPDHFRFGLGERFNPRAVPDVLGFKREDVSRIASVSVRSVRYDKAIPEQMLERLEEIGMTINLVANFFAGDSDKTIAWFKAKNPLLGDISPRDMIRLGRFERLRKFIINAMIDKDRSRYTDKATG